ncbi:MAG: ABC transporter ATP-binding protein [bacterium]|nr:ABC transporter ATP-binding protein [bacterium]
MIIEVENLNKVYKKNLKKIHALKNVSFKVEKKKVLGILGPNGAGKTTLLKIITGITRPETGEKDAGSVKLLGSGDITTVKQRIGFLPENPEFLENISASELLAFSLTISGVSLDGERIHDVLKMVKLFDERNERVKSFSKGMRQRIGIAQAIVHAPELLILDEPMSGLDPPGRRMVIDIINNYYRTGKTVLFSTHNLDDIEALCTDVMVLTNGEIQLEKSLAHLRQKSSYKIEVESGGEKTVFDAEDDSQLWEKLAEIKQQNVKIIKIQSGISRQLEKYYE